MTDQESIAKVIRRSPDAIWLGLAALFLFFANGRLIIFPSTWIAPIFLIRYLRSSKWFWGFVGGLVVNIAITIITWRGIIPVPGAMILVVGGMIGVSSFLPYLIDKLLVQKTAGLLSTLVFPCAWVGFEYSNSLFNPYTTWGSLAYTQFEGPLAVLQLASITGIWGLTFLITWFASLVNFCWENQFSWPLIRKGVGSFLTIILIIVFAGSARLAFFSPQKTTVRVASIISPFEWSLKENITNPEKLASLQKTTLAVQGEMLNLSRQSHQYLPRLLVY